MHHLRFMSCKADPNVRIRKVARPEVDVSPILPPSTAAYYQSLIGILRWIVELNRINIAVEVSLMVSIMATPRRGHLEQLYHIFAYLKQRHNAEFLFDPTFSKLNLMDLQRQDWGHTPYVNCKEKIP